MTERISGTYYSAEPGLIPGLLPSMWRISKHDSSFSMECWGRANTEQAIAWLDAREAERLAEVERRGQAREKAALQEERPAYGRCADCGRELRAPEDTSEFWCWRCVSQRLGDF